MIANEKNIRIAKLSDAPLLCQIHGSAFARGWNELQILSSLRNSGSYAILVEDAGFVMFQIAADECEVHTIAVEPAHQGKSIGNTLVEEMIGVCTAMGVKKIFLEVSEKNVVAINLYKKFRFVQYNVRNNYYEDGSTAILLQLML